MRRFSIFIFVALTQHVSAGTCTDFELQIYDLINEAKTFQQTERFREYGWSKAGPTNGWLDRWKSVRDADNELHLEFMRKYGYVPGEIYSVADAYRTGNYDSFYKDVEKEFKNGPICD